LASARRNRLEILLCDDAVAPEDDIIGELLAHPVHVKDFRPLSRAEIHTRRA
jgi:hypothetical protein